MAHYDGMREATEAGNESQRNAEVYKTPREAMVGQSRMGRRATNEEVVRWLADLQEWGCVLDADDSYTLASARAVIERLTKELQQRDVFLDRRIEYLSVLRERSLQGSFREEDLREQRDELTIIKLENKRIQEHLKKAQ